MERYTWLKEKRRLSEERMDHLFAPVYDENWGASIHPLHHRFVSQLIEACPPHGVILDAACGTGKYWPIVIASERTLFGIDQSQGMLAQAHRKFPHVKVEKMGLQEVLFRDAFDAIICVDAMENIFPEDWLPVLNNFHRALKLPGHLYFTVEIADRSDLEGVYQAGIQKGLPVVYGEWADEEGYHYYPTMEQVREWIGTAGFVIVEEAEEDEYHHFWVIKE